VTNFLSQLQFGAKKPSGVRFVLAIEPQALYFIAHVLFRETLLCLGSLAWWGTALVRENDVDLLILNIG
jgi:hypothetical protein